MDELTDAERINRLEQYFPRVRLDAKLVLKFLINRDYVQTNRWTKATVLYQIGLLKISEFKLDLTAQLFNPDPLIREVSAWALFQIDPKQYEEDSLRLGNEAKKRLDAAILRGTESRLMIFEKVLFYKSIKLFEGTPGVGLAQLADISDEELIKAGESLAVDEKLTNYFYIVYAGHIEYFYRGQQSGSFTRGEFVGEMMSGGGYANANILVAKEDAILLKFPKDPFYELLSGSVKLTDKVLESI
jgi:hypothetical protein